MLLYSRTTQAYQRLRNMRLANWFQWVVELYKPGGGGGWAGPGLILLGRGLHKALFVISSTGGAHQEGMGYGNWKRLRRNTINWNDRTVRSPLEIICVPSARIKVFKPCLFWFEVLPAYKTVKWHFEKQTWQGLATDRLSPLVCPYDTELLISWYSQLVLLEKDPSTFSTIGALPAIERDSTQDNFC